MHEILVLKLCKRGIKLMLEDVLTVSFSTGTCCFVSGIGTVQCSRSRKNNWSLYRTHQPGSDCFKFSTR